METLWNVSKTRKETKYIFFGQSKKLHTALLRKTYKRRKNTFCYYPELCFFKWKKLQKCSPYSESELGSPSTMSGKGSSSSSSTELP